MLISGMRLGHIEVFELLGVGGCGEVYRGHDTKLKRDVAIKVLPDVFASNPERLARFQREAEVLASLDHPNIARIHGLHDSDGIRAIIMEYVEGPTLADRIRHGPIPLDEALLITKQIADGLEAAHEKGVVHRDCKPQNLKIKPDGTVKILDFGLAKALAGEGPEASLSQAPTMSAPAATREGIILGTAAYMSPDQAKGKTVDRRADIWSFGVVFYEMLTGKQVFTGDGVSEILAAVLRAEPDWNALPRETPASIRTLLRRCLERDPKQRLQWMGEARIVIEKYLADPAVAAELETVSVAGLRRKLLMSWGVSAFLLVAALAVGAAAYFRRPVEETRTVRFFVSPPDTWILAPGTTEPGASVVPLAVSPDGQRLAFVARSADGRNLLWVRALDTLSAQALVGTDGASSPFWSPDSRWIGFFAGQKLKKIEVAGGSPITLCDAPNNRGGTWNRDGVIVFSPSSALQKVSASGGVPTAATVLAQGEIGHRLPSFLPDGQHFLYRIFTGQVGLGPIYMGSLDSGERKLLLSADSQNVLYTQGHLLFLRETTLMAQPFDARRLAVTGEAFPVAEQIQTQGTIPYAGVFSVSENGVLAHQTGAAAAGSKLAWFDRAGKEIGVLGDPAPYADLELSPDGKRAAVSIAEAGRPSDIWLYDVARGLKTRFTFDPADEIGPIWSPDGSRIVFASRRKDHADLYQKAASGTGTEELLLGDNLEKFPQSWSPDNRFILYTTQGNPGTGNDLWVSPLSGERKPFPFLKTPFNEGLGQFSPDGRWIAYRSNDSGTVQIYVAPFPGPGGKWQVSTAGGNLPRWRRDGTEIYYLALDNKLMVAAVNGKGSSFDVGAVKPLFETRAIGARRQYAVSADGQRFLINTEPEKTAVSPITVVLNWTAGLNKK